jgi:uncharacterized protein YgbK (DUF1537 family)
MTGSGASKPADDPALDDPALDDPALDDPVAVEAAVTAAVGTAPAVSSAEVAAAVRASGRRFVVLDDDPTGTQTVAGVAVLTTWNVEDLRWGLRQDSPALYVLTNTRSLGPAEAEARLRQIVDALVAAAGLEGVDYVIAARGDSTLRGHFPLETDVLADQLRRRAGVEVDGVVVVPAYIEGGRLTVDSVHWVRTAQGLVPAGRSEFAADATFGYRSSDLRAYVEEKTGGRWPAAEVARITLADLRGDLEAVERTLGGLRGGRPVVVDAVCDEDLRALSLALLRAEAAGSRLLYRVGPSFVRGRAGLAARPPLTAGELTAILEAGRAAPVVGRGGDVSPDRPRSRHGLVVVGSHVGQSTRQLEGLLRSGGLTGVELDVASLVDPIRRAGAVAEAVDRAVSAIADGDVVVATSRAVVVGDDTDASLSIARTVSASVTHVVRSIVERCLPAWVVGKGGITSSDIATDALAIRRAWVRGTLLPGIISLWDPAVTDAPGVPLIVFAGNVGGDGDLAEVVRRLRAGG